MEQHTVFGQNCNYCLDSLINASVIQWLNQVASYAIIISIHQTEIMMHYKDSYQCSDAEDQNQSWLMEPHRGYTVDSEVFLVWPVDLLYAEWLHH